jgi:hypothetical protein
MKGILQFVLPGPQELSEHRLAQTDDNRLWVVAAI